MPDDLKLLGLSNEPVDTRRPHGEHRLTLNLAAGKSGRLRRVPLTERDLLDLVGQAVQQLHGLRRDREREAQR